MKRFLASLLALAVLMVPLSVSAQVVSYGSRLYRWQVDPLTTRHTTGTAPMSGLSSWLNCPYQGSQGVQNSCGFTDSIVIRRGATTYALVDTSGGISTSTWALPPSWGTLNTNGTANTDTSSNVWAIVYFGKTANSAFTAGFDSMMVAFQVSWDGGTWYTASGQPTTIYDDEPTPHNQTALVGRELTTGQDNGMVVLRASPNLIWALNGGSNLIANKALPFAAPYMRLLVHGDMTGEYALSIGHWVLE